MSLSKKSRLVKIAWCLTGLMMIETLGPTLLLASKGPTQPEFSSFTPAGANDMVNLFTGDFQYNIPLMQVGDYPLNISYRSGVQMEDEASWVGLGWNLNAGAISRNMRGIPDDFNGDRISYKQNVKDNVTIGGAITGDIEVFGWETAGGDDNGGVNLGVSVGASVNNYTGVNFEKGINISINSGEKFDTPLNASLGITSSNDDGLTISPQVGLTAITSNDKTQYSSSLSIGGGYNSRQGVKELGLGLTFKASQSAAGKPREKDTGRKDENGEPIYKTVVDTYTKGVGGAFSSGGLDFGTATYTPSLTMPMKNYSITGAFKYGGEVWGTFGSLGIRGYIAKQRLATKSTSRKAYGYFFLEKGDQKKDAVLDYNREKDGAFSDALPSIALAGLTCDVFTIQGQGIGGSFRAHRTSFGSVFDPKAKSTSSGGNFAGEVGAGTVARAGGNITVNSVKTLSEKWTDGNGALSSLKYRGSSNPLNENFYLKTSGEKTIDLEPERFEAIGEGQAVRAKLNPSPYFASKSTTELEKRNGDALGHSIPGAPRANRVPRAQGISYISKGDLVKGLGIDAPHALMWDEDEAVRKDDHHIGEISTVSPDGRRYIYGLPAYNKSQIEATFAVDPVALGSIDGYVGYTPETDATTSNNKGRDNYYSSKTIPPYAHSFLLTSVLSPDYVDSDGEKGPSNGDLGQYTEFRYIPVHGDFGWRVPSIEKVGGTAYANHSPGLLADDEDDKGSYVAGNKEIWYLGEIETRDYVAKFHISSRTDVYSMDEHGVEDSNKALQKLDKIVLYSKYDEDENGVAQLRKIQSVHFEYDYSLCQTINGDPSSGKLTLTKIWFEHGESFRAKTSPYEFSYTDDEYTDKVNNPDYDFKSVDRWGNFQPTSNHPSYLDVYGADVPFMANNFFPYTHQNEESANKVAQAWNLKEVHLPTGGMIKVNYESDDYAFVQDKPVLAMHPIKSVQYADGILDDGSVVPIENGDGSFPSHEFEKIVRVGFEGDAHPLNYVPENHIIYMKARVSDFTKDSHQYNNGEDYVPVYFRVLGTDEDGSKKYLDIEEIDNDDLNDFSPIHLSALQHARINYSSTIYDSPNVDQDAAMGEQVLTAVVEGISTPWLKNIIEGLASANHVIYDGGDGFCTQLHLDESFLRLEIPSKRKYGGGSRVSEVRIYDNWEEMGASLEGIYYGQKYTYETEDPDSDPGAMMTSGVASYEPMVGGDENPCKQPVTYNINNPGAPDERFFQETPYGEIFYPSATVGYSKVTVEDIELDEDYNPDELEVTGHGTGYTVHEFYTSKEYPTISRRTELKKVRHRNPFSLGALLGVDVRDHMTASQGFTIELNNMHGIPKKNSVYQEGSTTPISIEEFTYQSEPYQAGTRKLTNNAKVIHADGTLSDAQIGMDYELVGDLRQSRNRVAGIGANVNVDIMQVGPATTPFPMIIPSINRSETKFRSIALTKVINRTALIEKVTKFDLGATVFEENVAYDAETGSVLITKTVDQYDRPLYSMTFPAYWHHEDMAPASRNQGVHMEDLIFNGGWATVTDAKKYFTPGDELYAENSSISGRYWVDEVTQDMIHVIDRDGDNIQTTNFDIVRVLRSGHRNMCSQPMATLTSMKNPLDNWGANSYEDVLQAEAIEFDQGWRSPCECLLNGQVPVSSNPYVIGLKGMWRPKRTFAYLTERQRSDYNKNTDIRTDGRFVGFSPYYKLQAGEWLKNSPGWTFAEEVVEFGAYGQPLETMNALGLYSSGTFGHNGTRQTAVAANARYQEIGFASFEDNGYLDCHDLHFRFDYDNDLEDQDAHTGNNSVLVTAGNDAVLEADLVECDVETCDLQIIPFHQMNQNDGLSFQNGQEPYTFEYEVLDGAVTIELQPSTSVIDLELDGEGTISVTVTDANGCSATGIYERTNL